MSAMWLPDAKIAIRPESVDLLRLFHNEHGLVVHGIAHLRCGWNQQLTAVDTLMLLAVMLPKKEATDATDA
jgi:hypothetical protein